MFYDVRNNCRVCGKGVDGVGNATICTFCHNNHPELHTNDCPCLNCQRKRATATIADISWGYNKEPDILPLCQKCGTIAKKNDFYGFWCPTCNAYPVIEVALDAPSVAPFADRLGAALGLTPVAEKQARPSRQNVYLDAGTSISRVIRSTGEHTGNVTHRGKVVKVAEVYDPVNEAFYWATESYARVCQGQGQIVFW